MRTLTPRGKREESPVPNRISRWLLTSCVLPHGVVLVPMKTFTPALKYAPSISMRNGSERNEIVLVEIGGCLGGARR